MAGRVTTFVFDKTGTITEESLSVMGAQKTHCVGQECQFSDFISKPSDSMLSWSESPE